MFGVRKLGSFVAPIFGKCVKFLDFSFFEKFTTVLLGLLSTPITLLLSTLNIFYTKFDNLVVFNSKVSNATILVKPPIKRW